MKNSRLLIVLLVVFIALAALVIIQNNPPISSPVTAESCANCVFTDFKIDDIRAIRSRSPETGQSFVVARADDGSWTAPGSSGTLDTAEADLIARTIVVLPFSRTLPINLGDDLTPYGFTPEGVLAVEIVMTGGSSHAVAVGYPTPTGDGYYGIIDDRPLLYLLHRGAPDYLIARLKSPPVA